jgi:hypothetical protein
LKLVNETSTPIVDAILYRHMVGKLVYLTNIRLYLMFGVKIVNHHVAIPQKTHLDAMKNIFKYVKDIVDFGIIYLKRSNNLFEGHINADWARDNDN